MFHDTQPAVLADDGQVDALAPFRSAQPMAIRAWLTELKNGSAVLSVVGARGEHVNALLWAVDSHRQRLTLHPITEDADAACAALADAGEATVVAYQDSIKLQFELQAISLLHGPGGAVLQAELPQVLYRFQRRDSFRVRPAQTRGPTVRLRHPAMPDMSLALRVVDYSLGGCALILPADVPAPEPGSVLHNVQVHLDAMTLFAARLEIKHASSFGTNADGGLRLGCAWSPDTPAARQSLQRGIESAQRRRRHVGGNLGVDLSGS